MGIVVACHLTTSIQSWNTPYWGSVLNSVCDPRNGSYGEVSNLVDAQGSDIVLGSQVCRAVLAD